MLWLRDRAVEAALVVLALLVAFAVQAFAGDPDPKAKAAAALALAKAQREREKAVATAAECHTDYDRAAAAAARAGKPLVLWVGVTCEQYPELRAELGGCVHCHLATAFGDDRPRVSFVAPDGQRYYTLAEKIRPDTVKKIKAKIVGPPPGEKAKEKPLEIGRLYVPPPVYAAPPVTWSADCPAGT